MSIEPVHLRRLLLGAFVLLALFHSLGGRGLNEPDEGRYAEVGREMAATGNWLTPQLNGVTHLAKPPLTYWLIAASIKVFGANEFAVRLPAALAALATLLAVYLLGRSALGESGGLLAVVVLLSSPLFFVVARLITTDMLLTCCVTWSVWSLWRWHNSADRSWRKLQWFYVFMGLGVLTKGPVAVLLPLMALAGLRWRNPDLALGRLRWGAGTLVVLAIAAPWFVAVAGTNVAIWKYFLGRETVGRIASSVHGRGEPWWFFFPVLAGGVLFWVPWLIAAPVTLRGALPQTARLVRMAAAWAGLGFILFSLSRSKLATYMLPLCVPLALLTAAALVSLDRKWSVQRGRRLAWGGAIGSLTLLLGVILAMLFVARPRVEASPLVWLSTAVLGVGIAGLMVGSLWRCRLLPAATALGLGATSLYLVIAGSFSQFERELTSSAPVKPLTERIAAEDPTGRATVVAYQSLPPGLPFYLQRKVLWYYPPTVGQSARQVGVFEYRSPQQETETIITDAALIRPVLTGSELVFCVVRSRHAAEVMKEFSLHELIRTPRFALLSNRPGRAADSMTHSQSAANGSSRERVEEP